MAVVGDPTIYFFKAGEALFFGYVCQHRKPGLLNMFKQVDFVGMKVMREKQLVNQPVQKELNPQPRLDNIRIRVYLVSIVFILRKPSLWGVA